MHLSLLRRSIELLALSPSGGDVAEFGVWRGDGLVTLGRALTRRFPNQEFRLFGFDTFSGLPDTDMPLSGMTGRWNPGAFSDTDIDLVHRRLAADDLHATLMPGLFADLPPLRTLDISNLRFVHVDADLYEGCRDALHLITPHIGPGTVLLMDDVRPSWEWGEFRTTIDHGQRALFEWVLASGVASYLSVARGQPVCSW